MKKMTSNEIRETFLEYFKEKGHTILPSASLLIKNDPTLLWNNAGVTPLKKYFDGSEIPVNRRLTSSQKCIRTNDIESVGDDTHNTFFEMLGNFSIGDYFKDEAIEMSYELLTDPKYFGFPKEKLYFTVYKDDDEAYNKWLEMGVEPTHIIKLENNFWEIGEGPCGPDSEIFYDRGEEFDKDNLGIRLLQEEIDNSRYVEIWNNVFSQYNAKEGLKREEYKELPSKNIDTGMGLERMTCVIQGVTSSYDTDLFTKIISAIEELSDIKYENRREFRIIADHIRTLTFSISDGAVFSNEGRGYVIRRLLRRAVRFGHNIGIKGKFMDKLVDSVVETMKYYYPELEERKEYIKEVIRKEEDLFEKTLISGEKKLNEMLEQCTDKRLSGKGAFKLYDTYGFPFELTLEYLNEKGFTVDKEEFDICMNAQKEMARGSRKKEASMNIQNKALLDFKQESKFTGYNDYQTETEVIALIKDGELVDRLTDNGYVILKETPFYAEMGGQISDTGYIYNETVKAEVVEMVISPNKQHVHIVNIEEGSLKIHDKVTARVNVKKRESIEKNHSATHLLHQSLKEALDYDVTQAGSKVTEKTLRFDFTYPKKITDEEVFIIENLVNEKIKTNEQSRTDIMSLEDAKKMGAEHFFEDKYENMVRVVTLYNSVELCGGTHVKNVGDIKRFAIKNIESKGANVYRIEATTDTNIEKELFDAIKPYNDEMIKLLNKAKVILDDAKENDIEIDFDVQVNNDPPVSYKDIIFNRKEVEQIRQKVKELEKEYNAKKQEKLLASNKDFEMIKIINNKETLIKKVYNYEIPILKTLIDNTFNRFKEGIVFIANIKDNNVNYICKSNCLNAGELVKNASVKSKGNGGGSTTFAQGGGTDITYVDEILNDVEQKLGEL